MHFALTCLSASGRGEATSVLAVQQHDRNPFFVMVAQHLDRRSIQAVARLLPRRTGACRGVPNQGTGEWCWTNPRTAGMMHAKALQVGLSTMRVIDAIVFLVLIQRLMLAALRPEKDGGWARARGRATADRFVLIPGR